MWHSTKAMIKTIWKRNVAVEMHPHDEGSSGRSLLVKLTRKMSFSIYGCANASPRARPALRRTQPSSARFLYLHSLTAFPAAEGWENRSRNPLVWIQFWLLSNASKATHTLGRQPSCRPLQRQMHSPASPQAAPGTALSKVFPLRA